MIRAALLLLALALVAYLVRPRRHPCTHAWYQAPDAAVPPICLRCGRLADWRDGSWHEPEDGVQADEYPWRVLARGAA